MSPVKEQVQVKEQDVPDQGLEDWQEEFFRDRPRVRVFNTKTGKELEPEEAKAFLEDETSSEVTLMDAFKTLLTP